MKDIDFMEVLLKKQEQYMKTLSSSGFFSRFKAFSNVFNYFNSGQTIAQIACGSTNEDLYLTMDKLGSEGRIILIDEDPEFIYNRAVDILGKEVLSRKKRFYTQKHAGRKYLQRLLSQANIEPFVKHLPPYPKQVKDESVDGVMAINAAFELMAQRSGGPPANPEGLITDTYKKLKKDGSFIVQGILVGDIESFSHLVNKTTSKNNIDFVREYELKFPPLTKMGPPYYAGYWARWVKKPKI